MSGFKKIGKNFLSISVLQAISYLFPLLILSFVIKKVGMANFGISNYVLTAFTAIKILVDYGYSISGVKEVTENKNDHKKLSEIFSRILLTKVYLIILVFIVLVAVIFIVPGFNLQATLLLLSFTVIVGQSLMPIWFFQAVERSEVLVLFSLLTRGIYFFLVFTYINVPQDYVYINLFLGIADIMLAIICVCFVLVNYKIRLRALSLQMFLKELKGNMIYAQSNILVTITLALPFLMLGFFADKLVLGYYGIADKILQVLRTSASILHSSIFPKAIQLYKESFELFKVFARKVAVFIFAFYIVLFGICFFGAHLIIGIITNGSEVQNETLNVVKIFAIIPLIAGMDIIPTHLLIVSSKQKKYVKILFVACVFGLLVSLALGYFFSYIGTAISCVTIEMLILFMLIRTNREAIRKIFG